MSSSSPLWSKWVAALGHMYHRQRRSTYCIFLITHIKWRTASDGEQRNDNMELCIENLKSHDISWAHSSNNKDSIAVSMRTGEKKPNVMHSELISTVTWLHGARRLKDIRIRPASSERRFKSWWKWFSWNLTEKCNYLSSLINPFVLSGSVKCIYSSAEGEREIWTICCERLIFHAFICKWMKSN